MLQKLALVLALASAATSVEFTLVNNSPDTDVFVQFIGTEYPTPLILAANHTTIASYAEPWSGRIWGRTDCHSVEDCATAGPIPASLAEITVGNGMAFYDLSLEDGFNIDITMEPTDGHGDGSDISCQKAECSLPILSDCPEELQLRNAANELVSCQAACNAFNDDLYCCRGEHSTAETCNSADWPVNYANFFKERCPNAYSYAYDDQAITFTCDSNKYTITFL